MRLSKEERNHIFEAIASSDLDITVCAFVNKRRHIEIGHISTGSRFKARQSKQYGVLDVWHYEYRSSIGSDPESGWSDHDIDFITLLDKIYRWANEVAAWEEAPDFWALRNKVGSFTELPHEETDNTPFTTAEQETISGQLTNIKEYVKKTYSLTAGQVSRVDALFDEAKDASSRLGRKDWILLFGGAIFSLILTDAITPDVAQHILMMTIHGLEHLFSSNPRSLPGHGELIKMP